MTEYDPSPSASGLPPSTTANVSAGAVPAAVIPTADDRDAARGLDPAVALRAQPGSTPTATLPLPPGPAFGATTMGSDAAPGSATAPAAVARRRTLALPLALIAAAILGGAGLFVAGFSLGSSSFLHPGTPANEAAMFQPFWDTWDSITNAYVGQYDRQALVNGAIDGMIKALGDPFSGYMSPKDLQNARESLNGQFEGIGAEVSARSTSGGGSCSPLGPTCQMAVNRPIPGSPAEKAGLQAGDVITAINGATVDGLTLDVAIAKVRGPKGTSVTLTLLRGGAGAGAPVDLAIVRDTISQPQVSTRELPGGAAYIKLSAFSDPAAVDFSAAVKAAVARGARSIVVDLRDNGGGYITAARAIASQFLASGPIFYEVGANGDRMPTDAAPGGAATASSIHLAVLVNGGTASASEIVAGALQDTGRAILVGAQTYGKGTIQEWIDLSYDAGGRTLTSGGFRLTIAKWLTPNGRWIHKTGLTPNVVVAPSSPDPGPTGDPYIDAALKALGSVGVGPAILLRAA